MSLECPICLEDPCDDQNKSGVIETNCGHLFCYSCLHEWQKFNPESPPYTCPSCRTNIPKLDLDDHAMEIEPDEETIEDESTEDDETSQQNGYIRLLSEDDETCNKKTKLIGCVLGTSVSLFIFYLILSTTS
jgi:hypothetical protein